MTPRVLDLSGARSDGSRQASPPQGTLRSQVSFGDTAGAAAQPRDASSILATHSYAIAFFNAANSDEDFDICSFVTPRCSRWTAKLGSQSVHDVQGTYERQAQETECY